MTKTHNIPLDEAKIVPVINQFLDAPAGIADMDGNPSDINRRGFIELLLEDLNDPNSLSHKANLYMQSQTPTESVSGPKAADRDGKSRSIGNRKVTPLHTLNEGFSRLKSIVEDPWPVTEDVVTSDLGKIEKGLIGLSQQIGKALEISLSQIKTDADNKPVTLTDIDADERLQLELYKKQLDAFIPALTRATAGVTSTMRGGAQKTATRQ